MDYTDEGVGCEQCYMEFALPVMKAKGHTSWLYTPGNQFTSADCDLLTGWYMDARSVCRCSENWYDNYYDYEYMYG